MQEKPKFFSDFSKENFSEERDALARKIRETRKEVAEARVYQQEMSDVLKRVKKWQS
jgi:hypothetical protein